MEKPEQRLHLVMDDTCPPYKEGERAMTLEDKLIAVRVARRLGLELDPESDLGRLSRECYGPHGGEASKHEKQGGGSK